MSEGKPDHLEGLETVSTGDLLTELFSRYHSAVFLYDQVTDSRTSKGGFGLIPYGSMPSIVGLCQLAGLQIPTLSRSMLTELNFNEGDSDEQNSESNEN